MDPAHFVVSARVIPSRADGEGTSQSDGILLKR
jgi:hypothetical protein